MTATTVDNPFFARIYPTIAAHETEQMRALRRENLAGLSGRVLEVGAGVGTNFAFYPDSVDEVVAIEPEPRLAAQARDAAGDAPVPVVVTADTVENFSAAEPFDAVVCSLVLCSVDDPDSVLRQLHSRLRPGWRAALSGAHRQRRVAGPAAAAGRRDGVAEAAGQLPHPPRHRALDQGRRIRGERRATGVDVAWLGAAAGVGGRPGASPQTGLTLLTRLFVSEPA